MKNLLTITGLITLLLFSCSPHNEKVISEKKVREEPVVKVYYSSQDTLYYQIEKLIFDGTEIVGYEYEIKESSYEKGGLFRVKKERMQNGDIKIADYAYSTPDEIANAPVLIAEGYVRNFAEVDKALSQATDQWRIYDDNQLLHQIGSYENGLKKGYWVTFYEDFPLPQFHFYNNGKVDSSDDKIEFLTDENQPLIVVNQLNEFGFPIGYWQLYNYEQNTLSKIQCRLVNDSIAVASVKYDLIKNTVLSKEEYSVINQNPK